MTLLQKIGWMSCWAEKEGLNLILEGECGFCRECVGIASDDGTYPDYIWGDENYDYGDCRADNNGEVWTPENAYHKHPCVAVLGRTDKSILQLYDWLRWFKKNNFHYEKVAVPCHDAFELALGRDWHHRMVKEQL